MDTDFERTDLDDAAAFDDLATLDAAENLHGEATETADAQAPRFLG